MAISSSIINLTDSYAFSTTSDDRTTNKLNMIFG